MRELDVAAITSAVEELFIAANIDLPESVMERLKGAIDEERSPAGQEVLHELLTNAQIAREERIPVCQDTGLGVVFLEIGQDVHLMGGAPAEIVLRPFHEEEYGRQYARHHPYGHRAR
jgi:fumarate hydratase subunit alpha